MSTKQTWRRGNRFLTKGQIITERDGIVEDKVVEDKKEPLFKKVEKVEVDKKKK